MKAKPTSPHELVLEATARPKRYNASCKCGKWRWPNISRKAAERDYAVHVRTQARMERAK